MRVLALPLAFALLVGYFMLVAAAPSDWMPAIAPTPTVTLWSGFVCLPLVLRDQWAMPDPPTPTPTCTPTETHSATAVATPTLTASATPRPSATPTPSIALTPTRTATPTRTSTGGSSCTWRDDFNSALASGWNWVRGDASARSLTERPGYLRLHTQIGDLEYYNDARNILLRAAPAGNWEISVRLDFASTGFLQQAGILAYQDDDHHLVVGRMNYYGVELVGFIAEYENAPDGAFIATAQNPIYLKLVKQGALYTAYYGADDLSWIEIGHLSEVPLGNIRVGLGAWHGIDDPSASTTADFDWFCIE